MNSPVHQAFDANLISQIGAERNDVFLDGYFQSHKYFLFEDGDDNLMQADASNTSNFLQASGNFTALEDSEGAATNKGPEIKRAPFVALHFFENTSNLLSKSRRRGASWMKQCASMAEILAFDYDLLKRAQNATENFRGQRLKQDDTALLVGVHIRRG